VPRGVGYLAAHERDLRVLATSRKFGPRRSSSRLATLVSMLDADDGGPSPTRRPRSEDQGELARELPEPAGHGRDARCLVLNSTCCARHRSRRCRVRDGRHRDRVTQGEVTDRFASSSFSSSLPPRGSPASPTHHGSPARVSGRTRPPGRFQKRDQGPPLEPACSHVSELPDVAGIDRGVQLRQEIVSPGRDSALHHAPVAGLPRRVMRFRASSRVKEPRHVGTRVTMRSRPLRRWRPSPPLPEDAQHVVGGRGSPDGRRIVARSCVSIHVVRRRFRNASCSREARGWVCLISSSSLRTTAASWDKNHRPR